MGRPTLASIKQYEYLQTQGELFKVYKIENKTAKAEKKPAPKFWPLFFQSWENQWPQPGLSELVHPQLGSEEAADEGGAASLTPVAEAATPEPFENKKKRGPLTVQGVSFSDSLLYSKLTLHIGIAPQGLDL